MAIEEAKFAIDQARKAGALTELRDVQKELSDYQPGYLGETFPEGERVFGGLSRHPINPDRGHRTGSFSAGGLKFNGSGARP